MLKIKPQRREGRGGWLTFVVLMAFLGFLTACSIDQPASTSLEPDGPALLVFYTDN